MKTLENSKWIYLKASKPKHKKLKARIKKLKAFIDKFKVDK